MHNRAKFRAPHRILKLFPSNVLKKYRTVVWGLRAFLQFLNSFFDTQLEQFI